MLKEKKSKQANDFLRYEREKRGWSQNRLAELIGADPSMISRWECGDRSPDYEYQEKLCKLLEKNTIELGFIEPLETSSTPHTNVSSPPFQTTGSSPSSDTIESDDMKKITRRNLLEIGAEIGTATLVIPHILNPDEINRLLWTFKDSISIDTTALSNLEIITGSHWQLVYGGVPKRSLLNSILGHLQSIESFLQSSQPATVEKRLSTLISQQAQMAVEIYFDMHDYDKAESYSRVAITSAHQASNPALYAVAVARMSFLYTYNRQFQEALSLLQLAQRFAKQSPITIIRHWVAAMEAEVYARLYTSQPNSTLSSSCLKALEKAQQIIEQPEEDPYWTKFSPASLAAYKGVCFRHLHKPEDAQVVLLEALTSIDKDVPGGQATTLVDLGSAYAQQGKIEEACTSATQALEIITKQNKSINTLQRVYDFRLELEPWSSTSYVRDLDEQIMITRLNIAPPSLK